MYKRALQNLLVISFLLTACSLPFDLGNPGGGAEPTEITPVVTVSLETPTSPADLPPLTPTMPLKPTLTLTPAEAQAEVEAPQDALATTPPPTVTPDSIIPPGGYRFTVQVGTPIGTVNFVQPQLGCNWMGVAGQVFSLSGIPQTDLVVSVGGELAGQPVLGLHLTGLSPALGPGGYEIMLADAPVASTGTLFIQLFDVAGEAQSDRIYFDTYGGAEGCEKNMILINFSGLVSDAQYDVIFPLIFR